MSGIQAVYNTSAILISRTYPTWVTQSFPVIRVILLVLMALCALALIVSVVLQQPTSEGIGAISGGSDTFFGKNKGKTLEGKLKKATIIISIAMLVISVAFFLTVAYYPAFEM